MEDITLLMVRLLEKLPAPTIVEVGVHHGQDTVWIRRAFPKARIWGFEPDPRNVLKLKKAGFEKIATLIDAAVAETDGFASMHLSSGGPPKGHPYFDSASRKEPWSQSSSLKAPKDHLDLVPWVKFTHTAKVKTMRLDTFVAEHKVESIDFVWADVQGAEDQMIAGGQAALARTHYLFTEYSDRELYHGQINLKQILERLPGRWKVLAEYDQNDVLLENLDFVAPDGATATSPVQAGELVPQIVRTLGSVAAQANQ